MPSARANAEFEAPDVLDLELQQDVVKAMRGMLSSFGDNSSIFSKAEPSTVPVLGAVMYHWRNDVGGRVCPYAEAGAQPHRKQQLWSAQKRNRNHLRDEGGALIIDRLQTYTGFKLVFCNEKWFCYDGSVWAVDVNGRLASQICRGELNKISKAYKMEMETKKQEKKKIASDADGKSSQAEEEKKSTKEKLANLNFNAKMSQIMTTLKGYCLEPACEEALNTNRDALPLQNGVVLLKSGILVPHHPKYLWSFKLPVWWPSTGLATPLGRTGEFLRQITHTPEALAYLQRILGYGITGHTSNQVILTMIGEGGAGKSLLLTMLKRVIGPFYKDVSKDMLTEDTDEFSEANVKRLTGEATITSRALYSDYVTFATTQLHILCSNYPPRVKTWTIALKQRLLTLVFPMRFFYPDEAGYNPDNPLHGIRDLALEDVLKAEPEKLLVFLVQGAMDWYASGKRLLDMLESSKAYMHSWEQENDPFAAFLQEEGRMNIKAFESTRTLMDAYNNPDRRSEVVSETMKNDEIPLQGIHVLVAEDTRRISKILERFLLKEGARATMSEDGKVALDIYCERPFDYDIILMNLQIPRLDGYEATRQIRQLEAEGALPGRIPIVALNAHAMENDAIKCREVEMNCYCRKPIDKQTMLSTILSLA
ncbi:hypothetical protein KFL_005140020 [Klebsormidium nitens]|uniref:Response regulatory domain-containing protein n=1 Tax=Klebsormidium nitens TaxID=105231 RepID=A0A1Y1IL42_KLENI|nr:hypothetical protein KFL_005140020 [Klebsormidium nitens]|eukprot:GAQ89357.1 hypothetical protein KFL_005140020 [Klebsormidium nitens]